MLILFTMLLNKLLLPPGRAGAAGTTTGCAGIFGRGVVTLTPSELSRVWICSLILSKIPSTSGFTPLCGEEGGRSLPPSRLVGIWILRLGDSSRTNPLSGVAGAWVLPKSTKGLGVPRSSDSPLGLLDSN